MNLTQIFSSFYNQISTLNSIIFIILLKIIIFNRSFASVPVFTGGVVSGTNAIANSQPVKIYLSNHHHVSNENKLEQSDLIRKIKVDNHGSKIGNTKNQELKRLRREILKIVTRLTPKSTIRPKTRDFLREYNDINDELKNATSRNDVHRLEILTAKLIQLKKDEKEFQSHQKLSNTAEHQQDQLTEFHENPEQIIFQSIIKFLHYRSTKHVHGDPASVSQQMNNPALTIAGIALVICIFGGCVCFVKYIAKLELGRPEDFAVEELDDLSISHISQASTPPSTSSPQTNMTRQQEQEDYYDLFATITPPTPSSPSLGSANSSRRASIEAAFTAVSTISNQFRNHGTIENDMLDSQGNEISTPPPSYDEAIRN